MASLSALAQGGQHYPKIIPDGTGGAIVTWDDWRGTFTAPDVYAQRVDASGAPLWTTNGAALSNLVYEQESPAIVTDGSGGAILAWTDYRSIQYDIYCR
jgi:hypothetical protein